MGRHVPDRQAHRRRLIPVVVFAIGVAQGRRFDGAELAGAALVIGALVANNLLLRRAAPGA